MNNLSDFFYLGKVVKTHGIHGELSGFIDADDPLFYSEIHSVFIQLKDGIHPYPIEKLEINQKGYCILKLKSVNSIDIAKKFTNKKLFLPLNMLPKLEGKSFYFHEIINFKVCDQQKGEIGTVKGIIENPTQALIQVFNKNTEILIPIHDNIIINIDRVNSIVNINAPDGLIDIYLNP